MPADGKSDMDRVGLFKEMGYISIGDKYTPSTYRPFNEVAYKNKQMLGTGPKSRSGLQVGYFDSQFKRIFEREALSDPVKLARQYRRQQAQRNVGKAFLPSNGEKKPSGSGSYYGTLAGPIQAMSAQSLPRKPRTSPGKNILTSPTKKGSGNSYPNITLSKMDPYSTDPYDRAKEVLKRELANHRARLKGGPFKLNLHPKDCFNNNPYHLDTPLPPPKRSEGKKHFLVPFKPPSPNKRTGGMKAGTFDVYPTYSANPLVTRRSQSVPTTERKIFHPAPGPKSTPVKSIISLNVNKAVHSANYTSSITSVMAF